MSTWNKRNFSIYASDERSTLKLIEEVGDHLNANSEEIDNLKESNNKKVSHDEMKNIYKLDETGDFTGSWFGIKKPTASNEGLASTVEKIIEEDIPLLTNLIGDLENEVVQINYNNFEDYINYHKILFSVDTTLPNKQDFPQGFSINYAKNEFYVARQINGGTDVKISRYNLTTLELKDTKQFTKSTGAYQEGLPFFYIDDDLCFLVRTTYSDNLAIFNYTKGTLGVNMTVLGISKIASDINNKYLISSIGSADRFEGFYVYDFSSIISGSPKLIKTVRVSNSIANGEKVQGIALIGNKVILGRGKTLPVITILDLEGNEIRTSYLNKQSLGKLIKDYDNNISDINNFNFENEGVCFTTYNNLLLPVYSSIVNNKMYFSLFGLKELTKLDEKCYAEGETNGISWIEPTFESGVTNYTGGAINVTYGKDRNGFVHLRGTCTHEYTNQTPNKLLFTLPYPYRPKQNSFFITVGSGYAKVNRIEVKSNGGVYLVSTTSDSPTPFTCLDGIMFFAE